MSNAKPELKLVEDTGSQRQAEDPGIESPPQQSEMPFAIVEGEPVTQLPRDLYIPPDALQVFLSAFEGPLDLLLYLIRKQNLDVLNIPIAEITRQYMEYIEVMADLQLELAGEYLLMAAMLAEIKSRMLLPRPPAVEGQEEEDPRADLVRRLQEYERFKKAAEDLDRLTRLERDTMPASAELQERKVVARPPDVTLEEMLKAFRTVLARAEKFAHHQISREPLSQRERMSDILSKLQTAAFFEFTQLFKPEEGRMGVTVTFIAILELMKEGLIEIVQAEPYGPIHVRPAQRHLTVVQGGADAEAADAENVAALAQPELDGENDIPDEDDEMLSADDATLADQAAVEDVAAAPEETAAVIETATIESQVDAELVGPEQVYTEHVDAEHLVAEQVDTEQVDTAQVDAEQADTAHVDAEHVVAEHFDTEHVVAEHVVAAQVDAAQVDAEQVDTAHVDAEHVVAEHVVAAQVDAAQVDAEQVDTAHVDAEHVVAEQVDTAHVDAEHVVAEHVVVAQVDTEQVVAEHVDAAQVDTNQVVEEHFDTEHVVAEQVDAEHVDAEHVVAEQLVAAQVDVEQVVAEHVVEEHVDAEHVVEDHTVEEHAVLEHVIDEHVVPEEDGGAETAAEQVDEPVDEWAERAATEAVADEPVAVDAAEHEPASEQRFDQPGELSVADDTVTGSSSEADNSDAEPSR